MIENEHASCRQQIADGEQSRASMIHLGVCETCAAFAGQYRALLQTASTIPGPPMPPGYIDRLLSRIDHERVAAAGDWTGVEEPQPLAEPQRRQHGGWGLRHRRVSARWIGAAAAILVAALLLPRPGSGSGSNALLQAARVTGSLLTARTTLEGHLTGRPGQAGLPSGTTSDEFALAISARGELAFHSQLHFVGSLRVERGSPGLDLHAGPFDIAVTGGRAYDTGGGGVRQRVTPLPAGQVLPKSDTILSILHEGSRGPVDELGSRDIAGGKVVGYRFDVPSGALLTPFQGSAASPWTIEAWVGADDQALHLVTFGAHGSATSLEPLTWGLRVALRLFDFGAPVQSVLNRPGLLIADGIPMLPLPPDGELSKFANERAVARSVIVQSVVADEGFWIGGSQMQRVFVRLLTEGESRQRVEVGDRVTFTGTVRQNPARPSDLHVSADEGLALLAHERFHIDVRDTDLKVS